jgi:hypothetical protein
MPNHLLALLALLFAACSGDDSAPTQDARPAPVPIDPAGQFAVRSSIALAMPPAAVSDVLGDLANATDGPDDPSRYLIELVIDRLPEGHVKTLATGLAPYVAAYVTDRIASAAPRFVPGVRLLVEGLARTAQRISTIEHVEIAPGGTMTRSIEGLRFDTVDVYLADVGLPDVTVSTTVHVAGEGVVIAAHTAGIAYGPLVRLGLDRAIVPSIVAGAHDLAGALRGLVDCDRLGALIADAVGIGPEALYANACAVGLTNAAARIYARLPAPEAPPIALSVAGTARAIDLEGDGTMDAIENGKWIGTFDGVAIGASIFDGTGR